MSVRNTLWVEKYRPESLDDIVGHDDIVSRLKKYADSPEMPHMLFSGPQGTGKTAAAVALAREIYGDEWSNNMMELNASDERGIDTIRDTISDRAVQGPTGDYDFQLIFLDEADNLTSDAQSAFRRTMEDYADVTRFILSCNYPSNIIDPIQSRCASFRFSPLSHSGIREVIDNVTTEEDVDITDKAKDQLIQASRGDARKAINSLQHAAITGEQVTVDDVATVVGVVSESKVKDIIELAFGGELDDAMTKMDEILKQGVDPQRVADVFYNVTKDMDLDQHVKVRLAGAIADIDWRANRGANPRIQYHYLVSLYYAAHYSPAAGEKKVPEEVEW